MPTLNRSGFTLLELLVVITIIAIVATVAVPNFQDLIRSNRVTSQNNELVTLITFARSEAIRRSSLVEVDLSGPAGGWTGTVQVRTLNPPDPDDPTLNTDTFEELRSFTNTGVDLLGVPRILAFNSRGYLVDPAAPTNWQGTGAVVSLRHPGCVNDRRQHRQITIRATGQIDGVNVGC